MKWNGLPFLSGYISDKGNLYCGGFDKKVAVFNRSSGKLRITQVGFHSSSSSRQTRNLRRRRPRRESCLRCFLGSRRRAHCSEKAQIPPTTPTPSRLCPLPTESTWSPTMSMAIFTFGNDPLCSITHNIVSTSTLNHPQYLIDIYAQSPTISYLIFKRPFTYCRIFTCLDLTFLLPWHANKTYFSWIYLHSFLQLPMLLLFLFDL